MITEYTAELFVHAIAIEREAAARYAELAATMARLGNHAVAALFGMLAIFEGRHLEELQRRTAGLRLPPLEADYSWRGAEAPETVRLDPHAGPITQQKALALALEAEKRARAFFEHAARLCKDAETRQLAHEMALEEAEHVVLIERMIERGPREGDWRSAAH